ncbi:hypothetical protein BKA67DRAFT_537319 [Truncatella angustata]|uniref:Uncharacterized protein n=1 Tax=Truncatella angustata TaxID=152316 RepID=A0A9P8UFZ2_9PEZI|nr:uncharacterized protein BKA67DRAFT_537319 [Truncatella angustata]KAH6651441.1 hypothetical protein BKA67DRAFT_537319 [Truncatella angustata]
MFASCMLKIFTLVLVSPVLGANLLVSNFTGKTYSLSLDDVDGNQVFSVSSSTARCGRLPAWLGLDSQTQTLYCIDENWSGMGIASSLQVEGDGSLVETMNRSKAGMSVHTMLYGGSDGGPFCYGQGHYMGRRQTPRRHLLEEGLATSIVIGRNHNEVT